MGFKQSLLQPEAVIRYQCSAVPSVAGLLQAYPCEPVTLRLKRRPLNCSRDLATPFERVLEPAERLSVRASV